MRIKRKPLVVSLCLLGLTSPSVLFAATSNEAQVIKRLTQREQVLEQEVHDLESELKVLEAAPPQEGQKPHRVIIVHRHGSPPTQAAPPHYFKEPTERGPVHNTPVILERPVAASPSHPTPLSLLVNAPLTFGGMPVVTSPYLGVRSEFDASDLVSNFPNVNLPFRLLQQRQKIEKVFCDNNIAYPDQPFVDLSGTVQPVVFLSKNYTGPTQSGIDLPTASLDAMANINRWVMSFIRFSFDNNPPGNFIPPGIGPVIANSRIFLDQGFVGIGNLNRSPLYGIMGQFFVPFGKYSSNMISSTLPQLLFRTKARAIEIGLYKNWKYKDWKCNEIEQSINLQGFVFRGDARTSQSSAKINQGGGNIDYQVVAPKWNFAIGASVIANIADSLNMQQNGGPDGFQGFAGPLPAFSSEVLVHRVPGIDVHASLGIGPFGFLGEYTQATTDFSIDDMTYKCHGARPEASYLEAAYNFNICNLPANIAVGYQQTREALAILLPEQRWLATFNISLWKDTIESIEVRHDLNYPASAFATGRGIFVDANGLGHSSTAVTGQIAVYF